MTKQQELDIRYLRMAHIWAENSYCKRRQVGALIVKDKMIISDGYNGTPSGFENICEDTNGLTKQSPKSPVRAIIQTGRHCMSRMLRALSVANWSFKLESNVWFLQDNIGWQTGLNFWSVQVSNWSTSLLMKSRGQMECESSYCSGFSLSGLSRGFL